MIMSVSFTGLLAVNIIKQFQVSQYRFVQRKDE